MPTSSGTVELTCGGCGAAWVMERRRGQYPSRCPSCVTRAESRRADREAELERKQLRAAVARAAKHDGGLGARARRLLGRWAPLLTDPRVMEHEDALTRVAERLPSAGRDDQALRSAVVRLAHARGALGKRDALEALAAVCVAQASAVGDGSNRDEHRP